MRLISTIIITAVVLISTAGLAYPMGDAKKQETETLLFLDGVYADPPDGSTRFHWVRAPTSTELAQLAPQMSLPASRIPW